MQAMRELRQSLNHCFHVPLVVALEGLDAR
jgi:hypothetical protein